LDDAVERTLLVSQGCAGEDEGGVDGLLGEESSAEHFAEDYLAVALLPDGDGGMQLWRVASGVEQV
jgi:hypothetical protein